jgi:hypothetical protein
MELTNEQWNRLEPLIPSPQRKHDGRGRGKGTKIMAIADAFGLYVAIDIQIASPHEVKLVESTIESRFIRQPPERMIGDKACDSDPLRSASPGAIWHRVDCPAQSES